MPPRRRGGGTAEIPPFEGEGTIIDTTVVEEIESSYLDYSYSVIYSRALPDARDGLKPVHRRILYSMADSGLRPDRPYVKSARVVGDCFVAGTLVETPDGLVPIEQVNPGDLVLDPGGKAHRVVEAYANPPGAVVRVRLADGREIATTPGQLFRTVTDDYDLAWVRADELAGKRVLCGQSAESRTLPDSARAEPDIDAGRAAYVMGLLVAEGCPAHRSRRADGRVRIAMTDPEPLQVVRQWASSVGISCATSTRAPAQAHHLPQEVLSLGRHGATLEMLQPLSADKTVPPSVLVDRESWVPFLSGLLDGDGYVRSSSREIVFTTTSPHLAQQVQSMLAGLGVRSGRWTGQPGDDHPEIGVCVTGREAFELACMLLPWSTIRRKREALELALAARLQQDKLGPDALPVQAFLSAARSAQVGGGWYRGVDGTAFRSRLDPIGSAEVRYGRSRHGTPFEGRSVNLRRMVHSGWLDLLERIGSPLATRLDHLVGHTFVTVTSVTADSEAQATYDIQIDSDQHAFLAEGVAVHNCMGKYHPHGDGAIYDAMVRLAQPFSMRVPLIDGHGNWGSPDDGPAASRYTECRLAPAALLLTTGLDEETVDVEDNYDGSLTQPSVLPAAYPNLLVNGAAGIAVGMATNMIPHNLVEVVDAARHLLEHPDADLDALMRFVPGPDLPTGGQLLGMTEVRSAYETGRGVVRMRATADVGPLPRGKSHITVTELPYGVGAERVKAKMKELVGAKKLQGIADVKDLTDRHRGTQLVIEVKAGFNPQAVLAELYRLTPLEESFGINNLALVDGQPRTLGLKELLEVFLGHRVDVVTRRSRYRLRRAEERAHLVEGLLLALASIDEVVRIIRGSQDVGEARERLIAQIGLTDVQAGYVLDMQLRRLVALEVLKLEEELAGLRATIAALLEILGDPVVLRGVIADELAAVAEEHGTPRRTVLVGGDLKALVTARAASLEVADEPVHVLLSSAGLLARTPVEGTADDGSRRSTKRARHDVIVSSALGTARGQIGLVTSAGRVLRVGLLDVPAVPGVTTGALSLRGGAPASEFAPLEKGERVLALTTLSTESEGLALATRSGTVKRVTPDWPAKGDAVEVIALRPGDEVVGAVELADGAEELVFFTSTGDLLRFPAELVRPQGRGAGGMAGVKLAPGAAVVGFSAVALGGSSDTLFDADEPVVVTGAGLPPERGRGPGVVSSVKVTPLSEYPRKGRATGGVRVQRLLSGEALLVLGWAGRTPAWAAAAGGEPVELPAQHGRRDGSGTPVDKPPVAVGHPYTGGKGTIPAG